MPYTENLDQHKRIIWQDEDYSEAVLVTPEVVLGSGLAIQVQQRDRYINLDFDGAKELIKQLQFLIKNKVAVIKDLNK